MNSFSPEGRIDVKKTIDEYLASEPLIFPQQHKDGFFLLGYGVECGKCGAETVDVRGNIIHHNTCMDIKAGGACESCKIVTYAHTRMYADRLMCWTNNGIVTYYIKKTWWNKIKNWFGL